MEESLRITLTVLKTGLRVAYHEPMSARPQISPDTPPETPGTPRRLRADAERNRAAILAAARDVFAEQGLEAPLEEIAARADHAVSAQPHR